MYSHEYLNLSMIFIGISVIPVIYNRYELGKHLLAVSCLFLGAAAISPKNVFS